MRQNRERGARREISVIIPPAHAAVPLEYPQVLHSGPAYWVALAVLSVLAAKPFPHSSNLSY